MAERLDFLPVLEGSAFVAVNVKTRKPSTVGWYNLVTNSMPNTCGRAFFDGKDFNLGNAHYAFSGLLSQGRDLFWLEQVDAIPRPMVHKGVGDIIAGDKIGRQVNVGGKTYNED